MLWPGRHVRGRTSAGLESAHGSARGAVVYAEIVGDLLHGVDAGLEGARQGLAADGVTLGNDGQGLGERPALGAWNFTQLLRGLRRSAVALRERFTAEKDLMAQAFPNARLSDPWRKKAA